MSNPFVKVPAMDNPPLRVLLVDDDENSFILIRRLLLKVPSKQFSIEWASTYQAGLEAIGRQQHDVYLLDYRLGMQSGLELLEQAIGLGTQAPIIILTAAADPRVDLEATKIGAADFLLKDRLDPSTLERSIRYSIQHFATLRALQKSHERFRLLFERSMDAILISDDEGALLEVNTAACKLLGYGHEELLEMKMSELFESKTGISSQRLNDQALGELSFTQPGGEQHFAEFSACRFAPNLNLSILRDITDRRHLEQEIQEISEKEQRRLGQDLHDGLGQALTGISFLTKVLQQKLSAKKLDEATEAGTIVSLINQALMQAREVARGLCPVVLEENDIHAALQQLTNNLEKFFGVKASVKFDSSIRIQDNAMSIHLYRIAQEASTNAIKHGKSTAIAVSLTKVNSLLTLRIKDNGIGFPMDRIKSKGMGLRVMEHRARMIGATLEVKRLEEGGTLVTCVVEKNITLKRVNETAGTTPAPSRSPNKKAAPRRKKRLELDSSLNQ